MADGAVRVLLIEDDDDDYVLAKDLFRELPRGAYHLDRVADYTSALEALEAGGHDVYHIQQSMNNTLRRVNGSTRIIVRAVANCGKPGSIYRAAILSR